MSTLVFDIETNGLNPTHIHCFVWNDGTGIQHTDDPEKVKDIISTATELVGHNIISYDLPVLERLWGIKPDCKIIDTLALSWYLFPDRQRHGLEWWGEELGVKKSLTGKMKITKHMYLEPQKM